MKWSIYRYHSFSLTLSISKMLGTCAAGDWVLGVDCGLRDDWEGLNWFDDTPAGRIEDVAPSAPVIPMPWTGCLIYKKIDLGWYKKSLQVPKQSSGRTEDGIATLSMDRMRKMWLISCNRRKLSRNQPEIADRKSEERVKRTTRAEGRRWKGYEQGHQSPFRREAVPERKSRRKLRRKKRAWATTGERSASMAVAAMVGYWTAASFGSCWIAGIVAGREVLATAWGFDLGMKWRSLAVGVKVRPRTWRRR